MLSYANINPRDFHYTTTKLRNYFANRLHYVEVPVQSRLSILAACEDPTTIGSFHYTGEVWPLPQTGQMWLEHELLKDPQLPGVFCQSTSYRQEANPIPGRHDLIFPMFEFESAGNFNDLLENVNNLLLSLQFKSDRLFGYFDLPLSAPLSVHIEEDLLLPPIFSEPIALNYPLLTYEAACREYNTDILTAEHEIKIWEDYGDVVFLVDFPERTSPFWNMRREGKVAKKLDVLLFGMETIGSAEREVNASLMEQRFHKISDGEYANLLFAHFGKERVLDELHMFLCHNFFPRYGGGIGMTRMIRALSMR